MRKFPSDPLEILDILRSKAITKGPYDTLILGYNNKTDKNTKAGWLTAAIHFAPAEESVKYGGVNMCAKASAGCKGGCLQNSGCHRMPYQKLRKIAITLWYLNYREEFMERLDQEIKWFADKAERLGLHPAIRPNALSDRRDFALELASKYPDIQFYDFSKLNYPEKAIRPNYHVTFSLSENNEMEARRVLSKGINVAIVFSLNKNESLPNTFWSRPVVDGDVNDAQWLHKSPDAEGVIVGLRLKGTNAAKEAAISTGFAVKLSNHNFIRLPIIKEFQR